MKPGHVLALVLLVAFTGCIEFSRQTLSYRYDKPADTLYIFQDYQGIFGADNPDQLSQEETDQLASVMKGGRTFFFNNWITEYDRAKVEEVLQKPRGEIDANPDYENALRELATLALANIRVENVGFYRNKEGQLCGAQRVTIAHCSEIINAMNRMIPFAMREQAAKEDKPASREAMTKYAATAKWFVKLDGNEVQFQIPMDARAYQDFSDSPAGKGIHASGGAVTFKDDVMLVKLGSRDAKTVSFTLPFSEKAYAPNTVAAAKSYGIKDTFDSRKAAFDFLAPESERKN